MDEVFAHHKPGRGTERGPQYNIRLRAEDQEWLETIAQAEGHEGNILPLLYEGVGRVIDSRNNPEKLREIADSLFDVAARYKARADELGDSPPVIETPNSAEVSADIG